MAFISGGGTGRAAPTGAWATGRGSKRTRGAALGALLLALPVLGGASPVGRLEVDVGHLRSARGSIRLCLTADPDNFPDCLDDRDAITRTVPASSPHLALDGLARGQWAVAVIHDENNNHRLDTLAGIPREGFGFSNNPAVGFRPPRFAAARFSLAGDATRQQVTMRYIL